MRRIVASEPNQIRKSMALESGADVVLDPTAPPSDHLERCIKDEEFDVSFDCGQSRHRKYNKRIQGGVASNV